MNSKLKKELEKIRTEDIKTYGDKYIVSGKTEDTKLPDIPGPALALDYKLGGGFKYKHAYEVFGPEHIGKTSAIAYSVIANAQKMDLGIVSLLAVEARNVEPAGLEWMRRFGVEPDDLDIKLPDNIEQGMAMTRECMKRENSLVVIDSLGAFGTESEGKSDDAKAKAFGISGALTVGLKAIMPVLYKNNNCLLMLNQQRQSGEIKGIPIYDSPGGKALGHFVSVRIHVKGGDRANSIVTEKEDGTKTIVAGEINCILKKVNTAETQDETAVFKFYYKKADGHEVGVDKTNDVVATGKMTGVIRSGGAWLYHKSFPDEKLMGIPAVKIFLEENPNIYNEIRKDIMDLI